MDVKVCDFCETDLRKRVSYLEVQRQGELTMGQNPNARHFCNTSCLREFIVSGETL
jgi:hypothetical protein